MLEKSFFCNFYPSLRDYFNDELPLIYNFRFFAIFKKAFNFFFLNLKHLKKIGKGDTARQSDFEKNVEIVYCRNFIVNLVLILTLWTRLIVVNY